MSLGTVFASEAMGTMMPTLVGCGVVAAKSGAHPNPAAAVGPPANGQAGHAPGGAEANWLPLVAA